MAVLLFGSMHGPHMCTFPALDVRLNRTPISALIAFTDVSFIFNSNFMFIYVYKEKCGLCGHPPFTEIKMSWKFRFQANTCWFIGLNGLLIYCKNKMF